MINILIIDHDTAFRRGLHLLIKQQEDMVVVGAVDDGYTALQLIDQLLPDVILMDSMLVQDIPIKLIHEIKYIAPITQIIILMAEQNDTQFLQMMMVGAISSIVKDCTSQELVSSIYRVVNHEVAISLLTAKLMLHTIRSLRAANEFTSRELDILVDLAQGQTPREIAMRLNIRDRTIAIHLSNIIEKIHIRYYVETALSSLQAPSVNGKKKE